MKRLLTGLFATGALIGAGVAGAHHSNSAYDRNKQLIVAGTVKEFRWANPHVWLYLMVPNAQGGSDQWSLEGGSVSVLVRNGWRSDAMKPGDHVRVMVQPNRDGSNGGGFVTVTLDDGRVLTIGTL
ncbi:MAG: DUF6152 family protein [Steroidobacteraceae bacterium]